ncbi:MAG: GNAT family N-acetyltransferase [Pseudomonadota bacterium]
MAVEIVDFSARYAKYFDSLNREWLDALFRVEQVDERLLRDPESQVIEPGGHILFACREDAPVGTVALKYHGDGRYELTKMAVTASERGQGVGRLLLAAAIERFRAVGGRQLYLESHSSLHAAIALYEAAGFRHEPPPAASKYERADVYMVFCS